ncbi:VWA domain-containing protein [bacterium]|nr:VWA domain-containing protein [bacterium]
MSSLRAVLPGLIAALLPLLCLAQDPQPGSPSTGSGATRDQVSGNPCNAAKQSPTQKGEQHSAQEDPFLKYATGVKVRISQVDVSKFPTMRAFVSVTDSLGIPIRTLKEGDFKVTEGGNDATDVHFANRDELDLPLALIFVVDISGSMEPAMSAEIEAIKAFVQQLQPRDRVGLITFSDAAIREVPLTTDHESLLRRTDQMSPYGQTALWDGIQLGVEELLADTDPARKALIVLSDGLDNKSLESPATVLKYYEENAQQQNRGFSVYCLGLGAQIDRAALGNIATRTGGVYLDSPSQQELADVYEQILRQIQNEYLLEYTSPLESEEGTIIDLEVGLLPVKGFDPGQYSYRSPGLATLLARSLIPGLIAIAVMMIILVLATIFKLARKAWVTVMITPLEGRDYALSALGGDIGSMEGCEVRIGRDPAMLPLHASFKETHEGFVLEAVDPAAPILMGPKLLVRRLLRDGDRFMLGMTQFVFHERVSRPGAAREVELDEEMLQPPDPQRLAEAAQLAAGGAGAGAETGQGATAARQAPKAMLAASGPHSGQRFELRPGDNSIGRGEGSIALNDSQVSRRHAVIKLEASGAATLLDMGSTNGTRVNGVPCQPGMPQPVFAGDVLGIGGGEYRLE